MKNKLQNITIEKDDLIESIDMIYKTINNTVLPSLKTLSKETNNKTIIANTIIFQKLGENKDNKIFDRIFNAIEEYNKHLPKLKQKVIDEIPDTVTTNTNNVNTRIVLALVSDGIFFSEILPVMLSYIIARYYTKSDVELDDDIKRNVSSKLPILIGLLPELEKTNFDAVIEAIGNVPTIKVLKREDTSFIPTDIVMGFFKTNFNIKDFYTQQFVKRLIGYFNFKQNDENNDLTKSFIGNPIYHLRLFLIDLEVLRYESLKEKKRLLELRLLELKNNNDGENNPTLNKQIKYYEDKLNKLNMEINSLLEV